MGRLEWTLQRHPVLVPEPRPQTRAVPWAQGVRSQRTVRKIVLEGEPRPTTRVRRFHYDLEVKQERHTTLERGRRTPEPLPNPPETSTSIGTKGLSR